MLYAALTPHLIEAGCDEVGRGCLAGPVVAASVILPKNYRHSSLCDSKQLSPPTRKLIEKDIKRDALAWGIAWVGNKNIDKINILNASFKAMHRALGKLSIKPELILIDGNRFQPYKNIPFQCIVRGDSQYLSIAAASVLAKIYRDTMMQKLAKKYTGYNWEKNMGYPTKKHREGLKKLGPTPLHRMSFRLYK